MTTTTTATVASSVERDGECDTYVGGEAWVDYATGTTFRLEPADRDNVRRLVVAYDSADVPAWKVGVALGWVARSRNGSGYATGTYCLRDGQIAGYGARQVRSLMAAVSQVCEDACLH